MTLRVAVEATNERRLVPDRATVKRGAMRVGVILALLIAQVAIAILLWGFARWWPG